MSSIRLSRLFIVALTASMLSACGEKNSKVAFGSSSGHPANWAVDHKSLARTDIETCVACHGENLEGGLAKVACSNCHPADLDSSSVHPFSWGRYTYARHNAYVLKNGTTSCSVASCHGTDLRGGGSGISCTSCHGGSGSSFSKHKWVNYSSHATYIKRSSEQTGNALMKTLKKTSFSDASGSSVYPTCSASRCHGADLKGVFLSGPSCYPCHPETAKSGAFLNHPESWGTAAGSVLANHGSHVSMTSTASCGTAVCHGTDFKGVESSGPSCTKCHTSGGSFSKHPVGWDGYTKEGVPSHGRYVRINGTSGCDNAYCHGTELKGGSVSSSCATCHSDLSSTGSNGKPGSSCYACHESPASEHPLSWNNGPLRDHAAYVRTNGYSSCAVNLCHGTNARGVTGGGTDCLKCHTTSITGKHPASWTNGAIKDHSGYAKANGYSSCATVYCHGVAATGGTGGSPAPSCYKCHSGSPSYRHPEDWSSDTAPLYSLHQTYVSSHTTATCRTTLCHPAGRISGTDNAACLVCHVTK